MTTFSICVIQRAEISSVRFQLVPDRRCDLSLNFGLVESQYLAIAIYRYVYRHISLCLEERTRSAFWPIELSLSLTCFERHALPRLQHAIRPATHPAK